MPPPKKVDLLPEQLHAWLREAIRGAGYGDYEAVTEALNRRLEAEGVELRIGRSAVGEYGALLKRQEKALRAAEIVLDGAGVEQEGRLHKGLLHMIAASAVEFISASAEPDAEALDAKGLMNLGRMTKDLMHSAAFREKILADERARLMKEAAEKASEAAASLPAGASPEELAAAIRRAVTGS